MIVLMKSTDRTDGRGTSRAVSAGGEPEWSGGRWASGAADPAVGGGPYLGADPGQIELQRCVYRPLEQAVWTGATGGAVQPPCRARPAQADPEIGGADSGLDAETQAGRRIDALEHAQAGFGIVDLAHDGGAGLGQLKPQRLDRYMASDDPDFERKAADIIGLYMNPPAHAAVF